MARSRRKNGGPTSGRFKLKRLGKGWLANRKVRGGNRPIVRITEPEATSAKADSGKATAEKTGAGKAASGKTASGKA